MTIKFFQQNTLWEDLNNGEGPVVRWHRIDTTKLLVVVTGMVGIVIPRVGEHVVIESVLLTVVDVRYVQNQKDALFDVEVIMRND